MRHAAAACIDSCAIDRRGGAPRAALVVSLATLLAVSPSGAASPAPERAPRSEARAQTPETRGLGGHVLPALARATRVPSPAARAGGVGPTLEDEPITLTVVLNREDEAGFQRFLADVYDPASPALRRFLSAGDQADRFGPSPSRYHAVRGWLESNGMELVHGSASRLTLTVATTRGAAERAFHVALDDYELAGRRFYANASDPMLPADLAPAVQAVIGLSNLARPQSLGYEALKRCFEGAATADDKALCAARWAAMSVAAGIACTAAVLALVLEVNPLAIAGAALCGWIFGHPLDAPLVAPPPQKIGLLEFDSFHLSDVSDWLAFVRLPPATLSQLSLVHVNGGTAIGSAESEVLLDIGAVMITDPDAAVVVYDAPFSTSFQTLFSQMIDDQVTGISNSWSYCEDQTTLADVNSMETLFQTAAAAGIGIFNASGDSGSTCLDGSPSTVGVPADAPHATAVGGTTLNLTASLTYGSETWWNGHGGYGTSRFFARPSYQNGHTSAAGRSVPDVVWPADPETTGVPLCQDDRGGCPAPFVIGGTSMSAPFWAGAAARLNEAKGANLGWLNPTLYPLAGTSSFHTPASMGSDFAHVGLGSPNVSLLSAVVSGGVAGPASAARSRVTAYPPAVPADGVTPAYVVVQLGQEDNVIAPGRTVTLSANGGSAQVTPASAITSTTQGVAVFTVKDAVVEDVTFTAHDTTDGVTVSETATVRFVSLPAASGGIQAAPTTVTANGSPTTITVTLLDAHGNGTPNKVVTLSQGSGSSVIQQATATTNAQGQILFTAYDTIAETVTYTATDVTDGVPVPGSAPVSYVDPSGFCAAFGRVGEAAPANGYALTSFATSFSNDCALNIGPLGLAFTPSGDLLVDDFNNASLYRFGPEGGAADLAHRVGVVQGGTTPTGLAFTSDGHLYAALKNLNKVVELSPATGAPLRDVAAVNTPSALAVDPLSGDLFLTGGDGVIRVSGFANGPGTPSVYLAAGFADGIAFGPDGTLYLEAGGGVYRVDGTNVPQPASSLIANVSGGPDGIALQPNAGNAAKPYLYVNRNDGTLSRIDWSGQSPVVTDVFTGGSRGDFVTVGPDACLYATQTDRVLRVTKADGTCDWGLASVLPTVGLSPSIVAPSPAQGTTATFHARLRNVASPAGTPIFFSVAGANAAVRLVDADADGKADFTYTGVKAGSDVVTAYASVGGLLLGSNPGRVTWTAGKHTTDLRLSLAPGGGLAGALAALKATLVDASLDGAPVAGASVHFDVNGQSCDGVTNGSGVAACGLIPAAQGAFTLAASYAGDGGHLPASASQPFRVIGALRGDANGSGVRDVTDVFYLINALFAGGPPPANSCRGDVNADGKIDVTDVFFLINFLFASGPWPTPC